MAAKMRFKRQYKPVGFGDPHDARSVEDKRRSRIQAAETRRLNRIRKDGEDETRASRFLAGAPQRFPCVRFT
jgi:hypothetical protein